ncbi:hypothetical protein DSM112329_02010 [Paraconexibacter sp. AEG42_29]|uniref:Mce/MlaD domain-containing protein n=1 Tax=Paraconexibacter sp. AEG42_29 TaxID=2997339 RepID=A0AAU7AU67_9ACTN
MSRALTAAVVAAFTLAGAGIASVLVGGSGDERTYSARFTNARGLLAGTDVRVGGAIAGRVRAVELADDGAALVRFTVDDRRARPRADAAAAIRPVDLLGDNYLSLSPGSADRELRGAIRTENTGNAPRLDQLLSTFRAPVRGALQALLVEGGLALDARGTDLAASAVRLRPALQAAQTVADELDGQNRALARAVVSADRAAGQVTDGEAQIGPLLRGLSRTLGATARRAPELDRSLAGMPSTLARLRSTATRLQATAGAATPLAADLRDTAPQLTAAVTGLTPLLDRLQGAATGLRPAVRSATALLDEGAPTLRALDRGVARVQATTPRTAQLVDALVPAAPKIADGFLVNFPDQAQEPGTQPGDPFADPRRAYWRGAAVLSCEAFGVPVRPGCLTEALASFAPTARKAGPATSGSGTASAATPARATGSGADRPVPPAAAGGANAAGAAVKKITDPLLDALVPRRDAGTPATPGRESVGGLLDFLLGR